MRIKILSLALLLSTTATALAQEVNWMTDFEQSKATAKSEGKVILMNFSGSDWCGNCIRLDKTLFQSAAFAEYAKEHLVLLKLDFPVKAKNKLSPEQTKHNEQLAERYNSKGEFPTTLILDAEGVIIRKMPYPLDTPEAYVKGLSEMPDK
ncbi:MAG: thioredoxin family protein [Flavobacteriales bacterium]|nr:thioredoxin family protein [Flavobacteriales bacterium]